MTTTCLKPAVCVALNQSYVFTFIKRIYYSTGILIWKWTLIDCRCMLKLGPLKSTTTTQNSNECFFDWISIKFD